MPLSPSTSVSVSIEPTVAVPHGTGNNGLPRLALKPMAQMADHPITPSPAAIMSKEWVVPPRPKPGRKPATDTPPTKRKAQNRVAQRAFRERRAARVGELEEYIKSIEEEHAHTVSNLDSQVTDAQSQLQRYSTDLSWWKNRCKALEDELKDQQRKTEALLKEKEAVALDNPPQMMREESPISMSHVFPCDNCLSDHCKCMTDVLQVTGSPAEMDTSTNESSMLEKDKSDFDEMEIDFTTQFSTGRLSDSTSFDNTDDSTGPATFDSCGFCQEGTSCLCAEMAQEKRDNRPDPFPRWDADDEQTISRDRDEPTRMPTIQNLTRLTPPPDDGADANAGCCSSKPKPVSDAPKQNPCANGPGTCAQCQRDPASTLFCKVLASNGAKKAASNSANDNNVSADKGCPGRTNPGASGCCKSRSTTTNAPPSSSPPAPSPSTKALNCADSYTVLSRHPQFPRATNELSTWLPRLNILPNTSEHTGQGLVEQRPAIEVEAASVMNVLRYFDRRFAD